MRIQGLILAFWGDIQDGLAALIANISGAEVYFIEEPYHLMVEPFVLLKIIASAPVGMDAYDYSYDEAEDSNVLTVSGIRTFTLQITCRAFDQRGGLDAKELAEKIRLRLARPSSLRALKSLNVAMVTTTGMVDQDYDFDQRRLSQTTFDLLLQTRFFEVDDTEADENEGAVGDYIHTVESEGTLYGDPDDPYQIAFTVSTAPEEPDEEEDP